MPEYAAASLQIPDPLLGFWAPPGLDPSGNADSDGAINWALGQANPGEVVRLRASNPGAGYATIAPIIIPSGVFLEGPQSCTQSGDGSGNNWGAVLMPVPGWTAGALPAQGVITFINGNGSTNNSIDRPGVRNLWVSMGSLTDGSAVDAIASWGKVNAARIEGVGLRSMPRRGITALNNANFTSQNFPDGWLIRDMVVQFSSRSTTPGTDGIFGRFADGTFDNIHVQGIGYGPGAPTGDGYNLVGGGNLQMTNCRADLMGGYGATIDVPAGGGGFYDAVTINGYHTQRNSLDGLRVLNSSTGGNSPRVPVKLVNATFDGDGVNALAGATSGTNAGVSCWGAVTLLAANCSVLPGTTDVAGGCPAFGLATYSHNGSPVQLVDWRGGFLGGVLGAVHGAAGSVVTQSYDSYGSVGPFYASNGSTPPSRFTSAGGVDWNYVGAAGQPAFANGWANNPAATTVNLAFAQGSAPGGIVYIEGDIIPGTNNAVIFTLPAALRPVSVQQLKVMVITTSSNTAPTNTLDPRAFVDTTGAVTAEGIPSNATRVYLVGAIFLAI